jgi:hypothetical protein
MAKTGAAGEGDRSVFGVRLVANPDFSRSEKPQDAFAAIRCRNHGFWIDNTGINAKCNFTWLMILLSLSGTDQKVSPRHNYRRII